MDATFRHGCRYLTACGPLLEQLAADADVVWLAGSHARGEVVDPVLAARG